MAEKISIPLPKSNISVFFLRGTIFVSVIGQVTKNEKEVFSFEIEEYGDKKRERE